jgi:RNA polymerase sigma-70 factor (ECF subfamily)
MMPSPPSAHLMRPLSAPLDYGTICAALSQLTDVQGQVIVLRFMKDLDVATVARIVGRSQSAVKSLQFRALASLRRIIESNNKSAPIPTGSNGSAVAVP